MKTRNIERVFNIIYRNLFTIHGTMSYEEITDALITLANGIYNDDNRTEEGSDAIWYIGECMECTLADLITGAYWHFTEWHAGQYSKEYEALSALGQVYEPNYETVDQDNAAYQTLNERAQS